MSIRKYIGAGVILGAIATLVVSPQGTENIKQHEALRRTAYLDAVNISTICYGSTGNVVLGHTATLEECNTRLSKDLAVASSGVKAVLKHPVTQEQFDAITSLTFNVGVRNISTSSLVRKANAGDCYGAGAEFDRWVYAKGKKLKGLVIRRADERKLWDSGCPAWISASTNSRSSTNATGGI